MHTAEGTSEYNFADCVCVSGGESLTLKQDRFWLQYEIVQQT